MLRVFFFREGNTSDVHIRHDMHGMKLDGLRHLVQLENSFGRRL